MDEAVEAEEEAEDDEAASADDGEESGTAETVGGRGEGDERTSDMSIEVIVVAGRQRGADSAIWGEEQTGEEERRGSCLSEGCAVDRPHGVQCDRPRLSTAG